MITRNLILIMGLVLVMGSCTSPKTGMEYIEIENGHTKIIDYDNGVISYIDHAGRVYKRVDINDAK